MPPSHSIIGNLLAATNESDSSESVEAKSKASNEGIDTEARQGVWALPEDSNGGIDAETKSEASRRIEAEATRRGFDTYRALLLAHNGNRGIEESRRIEAEATRQGIQEHFLDTYRGIEASRRIEESRHIEESRGIEAEELKQKQQVEARARHWRMLQALKAEASSRRKRGMSAEAKCLPPPPLGWCKASNEGIDAEAKSEDSKGGIDAEAKSKASNEGIDTEAKSEDSKGVIDAEAWRRDMDAFMQKHGVIYAAVQMEARDSKRRRERQESRKTEEEHIKAISYVASCSWEDATQAWQTFKAPAQSVLPPAPKWGQAPNPPEVSNQVPVQAPDAAPHLEKKRKNPGYAAPHLTMVGSAQSRMEFFRKRS